LLCGDLIFGGKAAGAARRTAALNPGADRAVAISNFVVPAAAVIENIRADLVEIGDQGALMDAGGASAVVGQFPAGKGWRFVAVGHGCLRR
jgi:hypothetical protein